MTRQELIERREQLVAYLQTKTKARDWHGVADAAMDLREVDAQLEVMNLARLDFVPEGENGH